MVQKPRLTHFILGFDKDLWHFMHSYKVGNMLKQIKIKLLFLSCKHDTNLKYSLI